MWYPLLSGRLSNDGIEEALLASAPKRVGKVLTIGRISVSEDSYSVCVEGHFRALTAMEFQVLWMLATSADHPVPTGRLLGLVGENAENPRNALRSIIYLLRRKLGTAASQLHTVKNVGYALCSDET